MSGVGLTVADVLGASPTRSAVFTRSPQSVEVYERGAWWPGSMLGWRHDASGTCQAWVRVEFAGVVEDAWVELTLLRLPEERGDRRLALAREPRGASPSAGPGEPGAAAAPRDEQSPDVAGTQHLPLVRDGGVVASGARMSPVRGRRRAPETGEQPAAAPSRSTDPAHAVTPVDRGRAVMGRHRAPAAEGRHRAAETGVFGAVPPGFRGDAAPDRSALGPRPDPWAPPPPRSELPPAGPVVRPTPVRQDAEQDLLTRPLRLQEKVGTARPSRRDPLSV